MNWQAQRYCTDINNYELIVEKQKSNWHCEQKHEAWRWSVSFHGAVVAQGLARDALQAQEVAAKNVPA